MSAPRCFGKMGWGKAARQNTVYYMKVDRIASRCIVYSLCCGALCAGTFAVPWAYTHSPHPRTVLHPHHFFTLGHDVNASLFGFVVNILLYLSVSLLFFPLLLLLYVVCLNLLLSLRHPRVNTVPIPCSYTKARACGQTCVRA